MKKMALISLAFLVALLLSFSAEAKPVVDRVNEGVYCTEGLDDDINALRWKFCNQILEREVFRWRSWSARECPHGYRTGVHSSECGPSGSCIHALKENVLSLKIIHVIQTRQDR